MQYTNTLKRSSELNHLEIVQINTLFHLSFGTKPMSTDHFKWKYLDNPFGDSYHLLTTDKGQLVASRAFWNVPIKNDHFQCVDTCVLPSYRGKGLFKETTMFALDTLDVVFYNAPNQSSLPQYLKYGWKLNNIYKPKISLYRYIKFCVPEIGPGRENERLINWKFFSHPEFTYKYFMDEDFFYLCRIKKSIPIILFKTKIDISKFKSIAKPVICATYAHFNGFGIELSVLSHSIDNSAVALNVDPYFFDMF
jgi:hypothetical protein